MPCMAENDRKFVEPAASRESAGRMRLELPGTGRGIAVLLPASYDREPSRRFPVLYFLNEELADTAEGARQSTTDSPVPESIAVTIVSPAGENADGRSLRDLELSLESGGPQFLDFLVRSVVPFVDGRFRTLEDAAARTLVGSGLGGLASLAGVLRYPGTFGRSVGLSTSFEDVSQSLPCDAGLLREIENSRELPPQARAVLVYGSHGLDECYAPYHQELAGLFRAKGWIEERHFFIQQDPEGSHAGTSWRRQLAGALAVSAMPALKTPV